MLDLLLIASLGFLGSFGHCVGMCGPIAVAFSLSQTSKTSPSFRQQLWFHGLLNLGRLVSYALVGVAIGWVGSLFIAGGQLVGIGSVLRRGVSLFTGGLLIWLGLHQVGLFPKLPLLNPMGQKSLHERLSSAMVKLSFQTQWWTPALLGMAWGLIPCGFLYTAQIKAAETGNLWRGGATMLAFGLGTLPMMLGVGISAARLSHDRRSQLFRLGGWITLAIGILILLRTGNTMTDYTGHASLFLLMLALIARPINRWWAAPLQYRRAIGVGAFVLAVAHTIHMLAHTWGWNLRAFEFMPPLHQLAIVMGGVGLGLLAPAAITSTDWAQRSLGAWWRKVHLLTVPAFVLCIAHSLLIGSHYLGQVPVSWLNWTSTGFLIIAMLGVLLIRGFGIGTGRSITNQATPSPPPKQAEPQE